MKKLLLLAAMFVFAAGAANAQDVFKKGDLALGLGIGLGDNVFGSGYTNKIPPISIYGEYGVAGNLINGNNGSIGVGAMFSYTGAKLMASAAGYTYGYKVNYYIIGVRGAFHYQFVKNLDTYAGLSLGYEVASARRIGNWPLDGYDISPESQFSFGVYIGARYYFTQNIGVYAELGYDIAIFKLGVAFKF